MTTRLTNLFCMLCCGVLALAPMGISGQLPPTGQQQTHDQWPNYQFNSNYSPLIQITPANVWQLRPAWIFNYGAGSTPSGNLGLDYRFEVQPLLIGGVMYISTPASPRDPNLQSTVTALEPETGKILWQYKSRRLIYGRGLAYWKGNGTVGPRLYFGTDKGYVMALDMKSGEPASGFGDNGEIDVYKDVVSDRVGESRRDTFTVPNPLTVFKNLILAGARPGEGSPPEPRGDIRAWDAVTGKLVWSFHTVPWPGETNHDDWTGDTWKDRSGCNVWSNMTADEEHGLVFASTGDSNHADTAPGKNLYCNSILAFDGQTGRLKWYHQLIHHEHWDLDMPTPPLLIQVHRDGRVIPAVLQTGKFNYVYIFDRITGEPLYGMEERPVRHSDDPDSQSWPTQPFPLKPGPIGRVGMSRDDINKMTPETEKFCTDFWDSHGMQATGPYADPLKTAAIETFPSALGGANWGPLSYNPQLGLAFVNIMNTGTYHSPVHSDAGGLGSGRGAPPDPERESAPTASGRSNAAGTPRLGTGGLFREALAFSYRLPSGALVPCYAPPYAAFVAIDVNKGEIAWTSILGVNESLSELGELGLSTGAKNLGGSIATASGLVFIAATNDRRFRAFDAKTGRELWSAELPAAGHATPVTYMGKDGSQYVVIAASGGTAVGRGLPTSDALIAFRLGR